jgi:hypothetical protein
MLAYWGRLSATRAHHGIEVIHLPVRRYRLLAVAAGVVLAVMGTAVAAGVVGPQRTAHVLAEWLPTSGGTGDFDPFARDGVNDGDDVVSGDNALSTGMVDSDTFLTSDAPSIYDMYSDLYGEPTRQRDRERAVALDGQSKLNNERNSPAHNGRASRDFATMRTGSRKLRQPSDRAARALFEIQGRTPLHIRATAFDSFDGERWSEAPVNLKLCFLEQIRGSCWMGTSDRECSPRAGNSERHQFKIASPLGDSLVPTPAHLTRFRIARVDQASFYSWNHDQILRLAERTMPAGVSVETECSAVDPSAIDKNQFFPGPRDDRDRYLAVPAELPPSLQSLAHQWTQGVPSGWEQISAVVQHLRSDYTVDAAACPPADCAEPLQWFLFESRRGPDYQFAGAAAVLLRVLGYHTRLVSGFYAAPEHYDPETASTPVVREDVHFWPEVMVNSGDWLVVEPTPGYEVLRPSEPWWRRAIAVFVGLGGWLWMHKFEMLFSMAGAGLLWWKRRELLDTFDLARLRLFPSKSWQESVRRAVGLLERRGRWAGRPRRVCETPSAWLNASEATRREPVLQTLSAMAEWFAYAPELPAPWQAAEVHEVCRRSLEVWTLKRARAESRCIPA